MALFHLSVTQTKRSAGQSAIASAAYRAGERLYSEYYGEYSDYTRKGGVICSDILLPPHAPPEYADRQTLWNAVEKAERGKNAQLAWRATATTTPARRVRASSSSWLAAAWFSSAPPSFPCCPVCSDTDSPFHPSREDAGNAPSLHFSKR